MLSQEVTSLNQESSKRSSKNVRWIVIRALNLRSRPHPKNRINLLCKLKRWARRKSSKLSRAFKMISKPYRCSTKRFWRLMVNSDLRASHLIMIKSSKLWCLKLEPWNVPSSFSKSFLKRSSLNSMVPIGITAHGKRYKRNWPTHDLFWTAWNRTTISWPLILVNSRE